MPPSLSALVTFALLLTVPQSAQTRWSVITAADGGTIGFASHAEHGAEAVDIQEISVQEPGKPVTRISERSVTRRDPAGRPISIVKTATTGERTTRIVAQITSGAALVTREGPGGRHVDTVALPEGVRFDGGAALLRGWEPAATPRLAFDSFNLDAGAVERMTLEAAGAPDAAGLRPILRKRYVDGRLRGVARLNIDAEGTVRSVAQPMFGTMITSQAAREADAVRPHPPYRVLAAATTRAPHRIGDAALAGHIRYRFGFRDHIVFAAPETGEQRVTRDGDTMVLDICSDCGPGVAADPATLAAARRATPWLQSDDRRIRAEIASIARLKADDARKMTLLTERARAVIRDTDFAGHYSAVETLARRAGDCTEAAVVLAAYGRAAGIPTLVANGLVYSRAAYHGTSNVFLPHSWVLAYVDGRWRSYDSALWAFDASHVALTVGDGDPASITAAGQLAGLLIWEDLAEVRRRPG